jgi:hypothetical protein
MNLWNELQNYSFKKMGIIFLILVAAIFLMIYATCGILYKVDCHEVILRKIPRGF